MTDDSVQVFFYGLFMDEALLARQGLRPRDAALGYVDGLALRIGLRATLVPQAGHRAHGVVMTITAAEATALYAEPSVAEYRPEPVTVVLADGGATDAVTYVLPDGPEAGSNADYAAALLALAERLGLPNDYLAELARLARGS